MLITFELEDGLIDEGLVLEPFEEEEEEGGFSPVYVREFTGEEYYDDMLDEILWGFFG